MIEGTRKDRGKGLLYLVIMNTRLFSHHTIINIYKICKPIIETTCGKTLNYLWIENSWDESHVCLGSLSWNNLQASSQRRQNLEWTPSSSERLVHTLGFPQTKHKVKSTEIWEDQPPNDYCQNKNKLFRRKQWN